MTAQIGIFNKKAISLATDSAVTVTVGGKEKVFNTAEKLFELLPCAPVGIMTYNNAEFMSIPCEVLIKQYRTHNKGTVFDTLEEYKNSFTEFITHNEFIREEFTIEAITKSAEAHLQNIIESTIRRFEEIQEKQTLNKEEMNKILLEESENYYNFLTEKGPYVGLGDQFEEGKLIKYNDQIKQIIRKAVGGSTDESDFDRIAEILTYGICSNVFTRNHTGIVIAGFGEKEIFAQEYEFVVELVLDSTLKIREIGAVNITNTSTATVRTYAQAEMAHTFIDGINPVARELVQNMMLEYLGNLPAHFEFIKEQYSKANGIDIAELSTNEKISEILLSLGGALYSTFEEKITEIQGQISSPFIDMVDSLDKLQLAELAENLVNLTSLKRKISIETETVGGPIDVAIITKNEGFIWIKRKYYFDKSLNPSYTEKKRREFYGN